MKRLHTFLGAAAIVTVWALASASAAFAASVPMFLLASVNNNTQTQVTVLNADPNAAVTLYYPTNGTFSQMNAGTTNASGYFTATITPGSYNISSGGPAYVIVNGAQSQTQVWPTFSTAPASSGSGSLSLSQNSLALTTGQSTAVVAYASNGTLGALSVPSNTNPSVAGATVSGSQITVNAYTAGSTNMTVCASNVGCGTLTVSVQSASSGSTQTTTSSTISFSESTVTIPLNQSKVITISGPGSYYISSNTASNVVTTSFNGSSLNLTGVTAGTSIISVCGSGGGSTTCGSINVTVSGTANTTTNTQAFSIVPNNIDMNVGETRRASIVSSDTGAAYYIAENSNTGAVTPNLNGTTIDVIGFAVGGANIRVCRLGGDCNNLYAYVTAGSGGTAAPTQTASTKPLALSSFSVSSNNVNNAFIGASAALTIVFSANQAVTNAAIAVAGSAVPVYGSGAGPYTGIYTLRGTEKLPLAVALSYTGSNGAVGGASITVGGSAATGIASGGGSSASTGAYAFNRYLYAGMTEPGVTDPDVKALQERLRAEGVYSGPVTGYFGEQTKAGVEALQKKYGITPLGVVGPSTRALLNR